MAGIYIHIPFCKTRCRYCDFFSTTLLEKRNEYVDALCKELIIRNSYLAPSNIETIYFGGGTPSLLNEEQLSTILEHIRTHFSVSPSAEITLEANPGDLTEKRLEALKNIGFNRLSIGIQSFHNQTLQLIGRRHQAEEAEDVVRSAQRAGFENISIDLIYGLPGQTLTDWKEDIEHAIGLNVQHISAYCLSYEENTPLMRMLRDGLIEEADEDTENNMYDYLVEQLARAGYEKYEVSNFSRLGMHSRHNSGYWNATPYIGLGAGAHSYDGKSRQWNIANLDVYIKGVANESNYYEKEELSDIDRYNELIMLSLRTCCGLDIGMLSKQQQQHCLQQAQKYLANGQLVQKNNRLVATQEGTHILNRVIADLMIDKE